jgi:hypothetical protein
MHPRRPAVTWRPFREPSAYRCPQPFRVGERRKAHSRRSALRRPSGPDRMMRSPWAVSAPGQLCAEHDRSAHPPFTDLRMTLDQEIEGSNPSSPAILTSGRDRRTPDHHIWWFRAGSAWRGLRRCSPGSTLRRSPDSPDRDVHLTARSGSRDPRRHAFDSTVAALVAACRAEVLSERTLEFYLKGLDSGALH